MQKFFCVPDLQRSTALGVVLTLPYSTGDFFLYFLCFVFNVDVVGQDGAKVLKGFMERDPEESRFAIVALTAAD